MADSTDPAPISGQASTPATENNMSGFKPITTQEELDRLLGARIFEERAKYQDYNDLKAKAAQFDALDEASKSDLQKMQSRAEKAEAELKKLNAEKQIELWKQEVAKATGVDARILSGITKEEIEQFAATLLEIYPKQSAGVVPSEGGQAKPTGGSVRDQFASAMSQVF